jgi:hypothetical protein
MADVYAALAYYFDHQEEIDRSRARDLEFVEEMQKQHPSRIDPAKIEAFRQKLRDESDQP